MAFLGGSHGLGSCYGKRLVHKRSWVRIPSPDIGWTFFHIDFCKICIVCLKRPKINEKEAWNGSLINAF